jgi:hypothetical protein
MRVPYGKEVKMQTKIYASIYFMVTVATLLIAAGARWNQPH